ncbi:MAG: hypothetical protein ABIE68_01380 [bacterium]
MTDKPNNNPLNNAAPPSNLPIDEGRNLNKEEKPQSIPNNIPEPNKNNENPKDNFRQIPVKGEYKILRPANVPQTPFSKVVKADDKPIQAKFGQGELKKTHKGLFRNIALLVVAILIIFGLIASFRSFYPKYIQPMFSDLPSIFGGNSENSTEETPTETATEETPVVNNEGDDDNDGLLNEEETQYKTDPNDPDSDNDTLLDGWEVFYDLDPKSAKDADSDKDNDGLTAIKESQNGTDPTDSDSDNDKLPDGYEVEQGLDPLSDSNTDADDDDDGLKNAQEYIFGTDPTNPDTDGDGFEDGQEVFYGFNPNGEGNL